MGGVDPYHVRAGEQQFPESLPSGHSGTERRHDFYAPAKRRNHSFTSRERQVKSLASNPSLPLSLSNALSSLVSIGDILSETGSFLA
jgi:hypothetical protein